MFASGCETSSRQHRDDEIVKGEEASTFAAGVWRRGVVMPILASGADQNEFS